MSRIYFISILLALLLFPILASAEQLTGTANYTATMSVWIGEGYGGAGARGASLFGWSPTDLVTEMATASAAYEMDSQSPYDLTIPIPQYADGTFATEEEIIFTLKWEIATEFDSTLLHHIDVGWFGGPAMSVNVTHSVGEAEYLWTITSFAFRAGSVGAAPLDFGQLKTMFE